MLAFTISQSYERWWEACKVWGAIANGSRTLVLQVRSFVPADALPPPALAELLRTLAHRQIAWYYGLAEALRGLDPTATLARYLPAAELAYVARHANNSLVLNVLHAKQVQGRYQQQAFNPFQQRQLDATPVTAIARTVEINLRELLNEESVPAPLDAEAFYLL